MSGRACIRMICTDDLKPGARWVKAFTGCQEIWCVEFHGSKSTPGQKQDLTGKTDHFKTMFQASFRVHEICNQQKGAFALAQSSFNKQAAIRQQLSSWYQIWPGGGRLRPEHFVYSADPVTFACCSGRWTARCTSKTTLTCGGLF